MSSGNSNGQQLQRSTKVRLVVSALLLLLLALGFNALLSLNSLEKLYIESIASQYSAIGQDLQRNIEKSIRFGKSIEKFIGIDALLEETKRNIIEDRRAGQHDDIDVSSFSVSIALVEGTIIYSTDSERIGKTVLLPGNDASAPEASPGIPSYVKEGATYFTLIPIRDMKSAWVATAIIAFDEQQIKHLLDGVRNTAIQRILLILAGSLLILVVFLNIIIGRWKTEFSAKLRVVLVFLIVIVIGLAQILFSVLNAGTFSAYYLQINKQKARTLSTILQADIEYLLSIGRNIDKLVKMDAVMQEILEASPELSDMRILDTDGLGMYLAMKDRALDANTASAEEFKQMYLALPPTDPQYNLRLELLKDDQPVGYLSTNLSKDVIFARLFDIALDSITILLISMLFFGELLILIIQYLERQFIPSQAVSSSVPYGAIRPAAFLFLFGMDISISFLPLHMENLYEPIFGLSKDLVMGLPISVEMLFVGLAIVFAGTWVDRRGWHEPFLAGLGLSGLGVLYSWLSPDALHFILSRALVGLGYGFAIMASEGFIIAHTDEHNKAQGLAQLFAGIYAGSICGGAAGGMLAERIGYNPVFFLGAMIIFSVIVYVFVFMRGTMSKPDLKQMPGPQNASSNIGQVFRFFFNRNIAALIVFSALPAAIAFKGFLSYFSPIYLNRIGASQSNIGRVFMIYGVCLIYIAPFLSRFIDASRSKRNYIVISGVLGSLAFLTYYVFGGLAATAVAILFLGLSDSTNASRAYALKLKITQETGGGRAMSLYSSVGRIGQVAGPMLFGWLMAQGDILKGIIMFGALYLGATMLFLLITKNDKEIVKADS